MANATEHFNTFVLDADYFNGFKEYIDKDRCDFLSQNYCFIGTSRRDMFESYILLEKSGRGFITLELEEDDLSEATGGLLHNLGLSDHLVSREIPMLRISCSNTVKTHQLAEPDPCPLEFLLLVGRF